jgi:hypothetical protein
VSKCAAVLMWYVGVSIIFGWLLCVVTCIGGTYVWCDYYFWLVVVCDVRTGSGAVVSGRLVSE